jgi:hypothetical protein
MDLRKNIATTIREYLNEQVSKEYVYNIAKNIDYETFLEKIDEIVGGEYNLSSKYNILYRGMSEGDELSDNSFMAEFLTHARGYGEWVDGIVVDDKLLYFDNEEFDSLRENFIHIILPSFPKYFDNYEEYEEDIKQKLKQIYEPYINGDKLQHAMYQLDYSEDEIIDFVYDFLVNSTEKYEKYSNKKQNDFFIPLLTYYAKNKGYNIISFRGSDFYGADEFVVNDISKYTKLSDIWKSVN